MQNSDIRISSTEIDKLPDKMAPNWVLIKPEFPDEQKTDSGLFVVGDADYTVADQMGDDITPSEYSPRFGEVISLPVKLRYDPDVYGTREEDKSLRWDTELQIKEGDNVWFSYMSGLNCSKYKYNGEYYYILRYDDIYMRERGMKPLNGYCLFSYIEEDRQSELIIPDTIKKAVIGLGKCEVIGDKVKYPTDKYSDEINLEVGDTCYFIGRLADTFLRLESRMPPLRKLDKEYFIFQRKSIGLIKKPKK